MTSFHIPPLDPSFRLPSTVIELTVTESERIATVISEVLNRRSGHKAFRSEHNPNHITIQVDTEFGPFTVIYPLAKFDDLSSGEIEHEITMYVDATVYEAVWLRRNPVFSPFDLANKYSK